MTAGSRLPMAVLAVWAPIAAAMASSEPPPADPPSPGEHCLTLHATTFDNHGHAMWCSRMVDGPDHPVWLYTGAY